MAAKAKKEYGNESISTLKGADRVRKRPGVIFGSDGLEGCEHSVFEILSNAIDEARQGYGKKIITTRYADGSVEVQDFGRGCPVDYNPKEQRYNWELVFCELYAGGKYDGTGDGNYEYALGLNGLGSCATQYSSEYMDVEVLRDGKRYNLHFEKGENIGGLKAEPYTGRQTGTRIRWKPDLEVFTDIAIPREYYTDVLKRQAVVNPGVEFLLRDQQEKGFAEETFCYQNGIRDYCEELAGENPLTPVQYWTGERTGRDREDKEDYRVKLGVALCFSNELQSIQQLRVAGENKFAGVVLILHGQGAVVNYTDFGQIVGAARLPENFFGFMAGSLDEVQGFAFGTLPGFTVLVLKNDVQSARGDGAITCSCNISEPCERCSNQHSQAQGHGQNADQKRALRIFTLTHCLFLLNNVFL